METSTHRVSPLRQRMLEDMRMRKLAPKTRDAYIRAVSRFAQYLGRSPDTATAEDLRRYQLHLVDAGTSPMTLNATITALKFLFDVTLGHGDVLAKMQSVRVPHKIPVVLSKQEVARLIACAGNIKHQTALSVAYGTGLRVNEVISLKVTDIDSQRMTLRVEQGMRDTTERPEAVQAGTVKLVGTEAAVITQHLRELLTDTAAYQRMSFAHNPYGDGNACQRIVQALAQLPRKHHSAILGA